MILLLCEGDLIFQKQSELNMISMVMDMIWFITNLPGLSEIMDNTKNLVIENDVG